MAYLGVLRVIKYPQNSSRQDGCSGMRRQASYYALFLALFASGGQALAQSKQATPPQAPAASLFKQQADQLGVRRCANLYAALGETVAAGAAHNVQTRAEKSDADGHNVQGVVGLTYNTPSYSSQAAGIVTVSPVGDKCEGQLVRIAPYQRSCQQMVALLPAGSTAAGSLTGVPLYNLGGNQGQALLVPNGQTCVVVTVAQGTQRLQ
jgi:hypothetical protein